VDKNRGRLKEWSNKYYEENKEEVNRNNSNRYYENIDERKRKDRLYRDAHQEEIKAYRDLPTSKAWRTTWRRKYERERKRTDPGFRLIKNGRTRQNQILKGGSSRGHFNDLLGCDLKTWWKWLETRFVPGMTRENYGKVWHVDHIRPLKDFPNLVNDIEQQKIAFHYRNTQPLFPLDNLKKGSKITPEALLIR